MGYDDKARKAQQEAATDPIPDEEVDGGNKTDLRKLNGLAAQQDAVDPNKQPNIAAAPLPAQDASAAKRQGADPEELSPIRQAMLQQMEKMDGKGVGMKEFDQVCSASQWKKLKKGGYTSCIDTQRVVATMAFKAAGVAVRKAEGSKTALYAFGTKTREQAGALEAWVEASPGMGTTPEPGDMLMLEKAGKRHDKASGDLAFSRKDMNRRIRNAKKQLATIKAMKDTVMSAKRKELASKWAQAAIDKAVARFDEVKAILEPRIEAAQKKTAERMKKGGKLEFSHVGFFKSAKPELSADGKPTGRQIWETFDGGQSRVAGAVDGQGAMGLTRIYDPTTNFITGEASQGGAARWLAGWVNIDKMVKKDGDEDA